MKKKSGKAVLSGLNINHFNQLNARSKNMLNDFHNFLVMIVLSYYIHNLLFFVMHITVS